MDVYPGMRALVLVGWSCLVASGCGGHRERPGSLDAGPPDAAAVDAPSPDTGGPPPDASFDAGPADAGVDAGEAHPRWVPDAVVYGWDRVISATGSSNDIDAVFTPGGGVVWGSSIDRDADLGGGTRGVAGNDDAFVAQYAADGAYEWDHVVGAYRTVEDLDLVRDVVVDDGGNVYAVGSISDDVTFGGGSRVVSGLYDAFIVSYGPDGAYRWDRVYGSTERDTALAVARLSSGGVCMTGTFQETVDFGGGARMAPTGDYSGFMVCLGDDGTYRWDRQLPGVVRGMAVDPADQITVGGSFRTGITLMGVSYPARGEDDAFILAMDAAGTGVWARVLATAGRDWVNDLTTDAEGRVAVTGLFGGDVGAPSGPLDFGGGPRTTAGAADVFVASYDATGAYRWDRVIGGDGWDGGEGDVAADPAGYVLMVSSFRSTSFDPGGGPRSGPLALAAYDPDGGYLWDVLPDGSEGDGDAVAIDPTGRVAVAGRFRGTMDFGGGPRTEDYGSTIPPFLWVLEPL